MKNLDWKLLKRLALLGVAMGLATVWGWVGSHEAWAWLLVGAAGAGAIARYVKRDHFQHGVAAGVIISLAAQMLQVIFFPIYMANNLAHTADFNELPIDFPPRLFIVLLAPVIAVASGVVLGVLAWGAAQVLPAILEMLADKNKKAN